MDVSTITMEPQEAQAKLNAYREALVRRHSVKVEEEWSAAERAYRELAKGTPLLDPIVAIREAGWREDGRPKLAIGRADLRFVLWSYGDTSRWWDGATKSYHGSWAPMTWRFVANHEKRPDSSKRRGDTFRLEGVTGEPPCQPRNGVAMIPMVPPDVIPARGCDLSRHFILWEVEDWDAAPPVDPILLRPIGGDLYAVVAQWNLTELERAIIKGTRV